MRQLLIIIALVLVSAQASTAQERTTKAERRQAFEQFTSQREQNGETRWHEETGTPAALLGYEITKHKGTPRQIARAFLAEEKAMLGIEDVERDTELEKEEALAQGGTRLIYRQEYKGVPVLYSGYLIAVNDEGAINYVSGDYYPDIDVNVAPSVAPAGALSAIQADLGASPEVRLAPVLSVYVDTEGKELQYYLAYQVEVEIPDPIEVWQYLIDAHSGEVLRKVSLLAHINGSGKVYQTNPTRGGVVTKTLHRLRNLSPRKLDGDNVVVDRYNATEASSSNGQFYYSTTDARFDEVMAYYHSDEFEAWLIGKGMETNRVAKVTVTTRWPSGWAFADPPMRKVFFQSSGPGLNNPTKEAAVIAHEYMHVVSETYNALDQDAQAQAMDEAYSDYFGVAYRHEFGGVASTVWNEYGDQPGGLNYKRDLNNTRTMSEYGTIDLEPNGNVGRHDRSVILSGALWDFRAHPSTNPSKADEIVLASLALLDNSPSFLDARGVLLTAADNAGFSSYACAIQEVFVKHGIGTAASSCAPLAPTNFRISNSGSVGAHPILAWNASSGATSYSVYRCYYGQGSYCQNEITDFSSIGSTSSTSLTDYNSVLGSSGSGLLYYYVKARNGAGFSPRSSIVAEPGVPANKQDAAALAAQGGALEALPTEYALEPNYPNPFNPSTEIRFALPEAANVRLVVYDALGREVARLVDGPVVAGYQHATFDAANLPSGVYLYRLEARGGAETFAKTGQMVLVK